MDEIEIKFTDKERDLILNQTLATPELTERLKVAELVGKHVKASYDLDDLEDLLGFIAAEANHAEDGKLQKQLDNLFERLSRIQEKLL